MVAGIGALLSLRRYLGFHVMQAISQLKGSLKQLSTAHAQLLGELQVALPLQHASEQAVQQLHSAGVGSTSSATAASTQIPRSPPAKGSAA